MSTYYEILEVSENASADVIKVSYRALARKFHPDVYVGDKGFANEQLKVLNAAYEVLSDPVKREVYDNYLKSVFYKKETTKDYGQDDSEAKWHKEREPESNKENSKESSTESDDKYTSYNQESVKQATSSNEKKEETIYENKKTKITLGKVLVLVFVILGLLFGLYYIQDNMKQRDMEEQKEEEIQAYEVGVQEYKDNEEKILGKLFEKYPSEGYYLFSERIEIPHGEDENYDRLKADFELSRKDPRKYLETLEMSENEMVKADGTFYNDYFEMLKDKHPDKYEQIKANNYLDWHTRQEPDIKTVYGWRGIKVEDDLFESYYVEFAFDLRNTDMNDGYSRYAFEVSFSDEGIGRVKSIYGNKELQDKYKEYYDYVW